ncbi:hypothetical protein M9H77_35428 [Catharanthus roseus]|uniref:Uncharacterized protein n=1 Tax=Catharanthus roseus TaxID=4058 RepID=A0ACB9ZPP9_CATRO|nr:hypothetical protein M9H77_35428 [Catharanthus roseus]
MRLRSEGSDNFLSLICDASTRLVKRSRCSASIHLLGSSLFLPGVSICGGETRLDLNVGTHKTSLRMMSGLNYMDPLWVTSKIVPDECFYPNGYGMDDKCSTQVPP